MSTVALLSAAIGVVTPASVVAAASGALSASSTAGSLGCSGSGQQAAMPVALREGVDIADHQALVRPDATQDRTIAYDDATLKVGPGAVAAPATIGITPLLEGELPELDSGMTNVTAGPRGGYRFTPHPYRFRKQIEISVPYDLALVGSEFSVDDVYTYFFDEQAGCWQPLERVAVDEAKQVIVSRSDHFTDMINATVAVPDHPEGSSFNPTQIKDIQAADPGSRVNLIAPPTPNSVGDNRLAYPIEIPPGRGGLQPQLGVQYNSSSGNSWMGMGWDLPMQSIVVDTRWGVPRYDLGLETETYMLAGEQLTPVAHRGALQPRSAEKVFHTRVEGNFARIVRHGDSPANYSWEITDKAGTHWFYGGATEATLTDAGGNVFQWALREVRDANGNLMRYHNVRVDDVGVVNGSVAGTNLYVHRITYTGSGATEGAYEVSFRRDREVDTPWQRRADVAIDARGGFKKVTADLLRHVDVSLNGQLIRRYRFEYTTGAFHKTLLSSVSQLDGAGTVFNTHSFDYFDDIRDGTGAYQAFDTVDWTSPDDGLGNDILSLIAGPARRAP